MEWKNGMRFDSWTVRSLCRAGSLTAVARELGIYINRIKCKAWSGFIWLRIGTGGGHLKIL
jgi:hypothetical protein